jgi:hypothetical protein
MELSRETLPCFNSPPQELSFITSIVVHQHPMQCSLVPVHWGHVVVSFVVWLPLVFQTTSTRPCGPLCIEVRSPLPRAHLPARHPSLTPFPALRSRGKLDIRDEWSGSSVQAPLHRENAMIPPKPISLQPLLNSSEPRTPTPNTRLGFCFGRSGAWRLGAGSYCVC